MAKPQHGQVHARVPLEVEVGLRDLASRTHTTVGDLVRQACSALVRGAHGPAAGSTDGAARAGRPQADRGPSAPPRPAQERPRLPLSERPRVYFDEQMGGLVHDYSHLDFDVFVRAVRRP